MALVTALIARMSQDEEGQGLAEYALILALIAIVAIVASSSSAGRSRRSSTRSARPSNRANTRGRRRCRRPRCFSALDPRGGSPGEAADGTIVPLEAPVEPRRVRLSPGRSRAHAIIGETPNGACQRTHRPHVAGRRGPGSRGVRADPRPDRDRRDRRPHLPGRPDLRDPAHRRGFGLTTREPGNTNGQRLLPVAVLVFRFGSGVASATGVQSRTQAGERRLTPSPIAGTFRPRRVDTRALRKGGNYPKCRFSMHSSPASRRTRRARVSPSTR